MLFTRGLRIELQCESDEAQKVTRALQFGRTFCDILTQTISRKRPTIVVVHADKLEIEKGIRLEGNKILWPYSETVESAEDANLTDVVDATISWIVSSSVRQAHS